MKVKSDVTSRIQCKEVTPTRGRRKQYPRRPSQLQPALHEVKRDTGQPTDLNVGERDVLELPWARATDALPGGPAPTENAAAVNHEPDLQLRRSTRDRRVPASMGDFLFRMKIHAMVKFLHLR